MGQKSIILAIGLIIFTIILAVLFVIGRMKSNTPSQADETPMEASTRNVVPVADIISEPMVYDEYSLEVDSEITGWVTNRAFLFGARIGSGISGGRTRYLLAVGSSPFQLPQDPNDGKVGLGENARVTAKGRVEIMNKDQLEATLGIDLDDPNNALYSDAIKDWNLGPVLVINELKIDSTIR